MKLLIVNLSPSLFEASEQVLALPIGPRNDEKKTIIDKDVHVKDSDMFLRIFFLHFIPFLSPQWLCRYIIARE
jgi:hypothetical protein